MPASQKDLHLQSNSACRKDKVISTANLSTSTELDHREDEDENGYVLIDDYVRRFPPPNRKSCFEMQPGMQRFTRAQQSSLPSPISMSPNAVCSGRSRSVHSRRSFASKANRGNATNANAHENSILNAVGNTPVQNYSGCSATSETDNDIVYVLPENPPCTHEPIRGEYSNQIESGKMPSESFPRMYDDIIPTTPVKLTYTTESWLHKDQASNHHGFGFVATRENPAYAMIPDAYDNVFHTVSENQIYTNDSAIDQDGNCIGDHDVVTQANPAYAATPRMYEDFIRTAPIISEYTNESTLGENSY